jgi:hypothetical protein
MSLRNVSWKLLLAVSFGATSGWAESWPELTDLVPRARLIAHGRTAEVAGDVHYRIVAVLHGQAPASGYLPCGDCEPGREAILIYTLHNNPAGRELSQRDMLLPVVDGKVRYPGATGERFTSAREYALEEFSRQIQALSSGPRTQLTKSTLRVEVEIERGGEIDRVTVYLINATREPVQFFAGGPDALDHLDDRAEVVRYSAPYVLPELTFRQPGRMVSVRPPILGGPPQRSRTGVVTVPVDQRLKYASWAVPHEHVVGKLEKVHLWRWDGTVLDANGKWNEVKVIETQR